jgi:hypothetical protein
VGTSKRLLVAVLGLAVFPLRKIVRECDAIAEEVSEHIRAEAIRDEERYERCEGEWRSRA